MPCVMLGCINLLAILCCVLGGCKPLTPIFDQLDAFEIVQGGGIYLVEVSGHQVYSIHLAGVCVCVQYKCMHRIKEEGKEGLRVRRREEGYTVTIVNLMRYI